MAKKKTFRFKIGDRVKILSGHFFESTAKKADYEDNNNKKATIVKNDESKYFNYRVKLDKNDGWSYHDDEELELVVEDQSVPAVQTLVADSGEEITKFINGFSDDNKPTFASLNVENLYGHPRFYEILDQMKDLHSRKNHDYAGTSDPLKNLRACERLGIDPFMGVLVRLQDKSSRIEEFARSGTLEVKSESVIDTLLDNAVYSILAIVLFEEQQEKKNEK